MRYVANSKMCQQNPLILRTCAAKQFSYVEMFILLKKKPNKIVGNKGDLE